MNLLAYAAEARDAGSTLESGRSPRERNDNQLQDQYLENPMYRGAWWPTVYKVTKSQTGLRVYEFTATTGLGFQRFGCL